MNKRVMRVFVGGLLEKVFLGHCCNLVRLCTLLSRSVPRSAMYNLSSLLALVTGLCLRVWL